MSLVRSIALHFHSQCYTCKSVFWHTFGPHHPSAFRNVRWTRSSSDLGRPSSSEMPGISLRQSAAAYTHLQFRTRALKSVYVTESQATEALRSVAQAEVLTNEGNS